ncbi:GNAT family N-acetyltransferase [Dyella humicola]|uniref:GNAT family N-acetyltransferase n=1 Tax=Dyella humicola TaxID=2992126 RepID=UPI00224F00ED|nr:GNAT family N-acetyltransferase [Dyella humicola]
MAIHLFHADTDEQIAATFDVMQQLRPHLQRSEYGALIRSLMASDGLRLLALADGDVVRAVAGYRVMNMLYCGRALFIDDLVSDEHARSLGYGSQLIARIKDEAQTLGCSEVQLISRVTREQAHRFYFREGFGIECFHFRNKLA